MLSGWSWRPSGSACTTGWRRWARPAGGCGHGGGVGAERQAALVAAALAPLLCARVDAARLHAG